MHCIVARESKLPTKLTAHSQTWVLLAVELQQQSSAWVSVCAASLVGLTAQIRLQVAADTRLLEPELRFVCMNCSYRADSNVDVPKDLSD